MYFRGIPHFKDYRMTLVTSENSDELYSTFNEIEEKFADHAFVLGSSL